MIPITPNDQERIVATLTHSHTIPADIAMGNIAAGDISPTYIVIPGKDGEPALTIGHEGVVVGPGWDGPEAVVEAFKRAFPWVRTREQSPEHGELREAIAHRLFDWDVEDGICPQTWATLTTDQRDVWLSAADALIAGPLAGLLAEVERLRAVSEVDQQILRNAVVQLGSVIARRDEANRKLDAVRELADKADKPSDPFGFEFIRGSVRTSALRRVITDPATVLARRDAEVAARAWDEGQACGWEFGPEATNPAAENPYRIEKGEQG